MLDDYDLTVIGGASAKRLHIPMGEKFVWRIVADQLRSLATQLDVYSRLPETPELNERTMHVIIANMIDSANRTISDAAEQAGIKIYDGRARARKAQERKADNAGTVQTDGRSSPQLVDLQRLKR